MSNLYESPKPSTTVSVDRKTSLARGLAWAIPFGACGFCAPYLMFGLELALRIAFTDMLPLVRAEEINELPLKGLAAAVLCSVLFAWSAFANYSARRGVGFVRSLLVMASFLLGTTLFVGLFRAMLGIDRKGIHTSEGTNEQVCNLIFAVIFLTGAVGFTIWQIRRSEVK